MSYQTQQAKRCPRCGNVNAVAAQQCPCGHVFTTQFSGGQPTQAFYAPQPVSDGQGYAVAAMVCGIIALVSPCFWFVSIPCGIIGCVMGYMGLHSRGRGMAIAGIVTGVLALAFVAFWSLLFASALATPTKSPTSTGRPVYNDTTYYQEPREEVRTVQQPKPNVIWNSPDTQARDFSRYPIATPNYRTPAPSPRQTTAPRASFGGGYDGNQGAADPFANQ